MEFGHINIEILSRGNGRELRLYDNCRSVQTDVEDTLQQKLISESCFEIIKILPEKKEVCGVKICRRCDNCGSSMVLDFQEGESAILECPRCKERMFFRKHIMPGLF